MSPVVMLYGGTVYCIIIELFVQDVNTKTVLAAYVGVGTGVAVGVGGVSGGGFYGVGACFC